MSRDITVSQLKYILDSYPSDMPIRMATHPSYPLQSHLDRRVRPYRGKLYLLEGSQVYPDPYLPKSLWSDGYEGEVCFNCGSPSVIGEVPTEGPVCSTCLVCRLPPSVAVSFTLFRS